MFNLDSFNEAQKLALLFGIMVGEGCLSKHINKRGYSCYFVSISGNYYDDKPFYNSIIVPLIDFFRKGSKHTPIRERVDQGKIELNFCDKILFHRLKEVGFPVGKKGQKLGIPNYFYHRHLIKYIVQGFFATDGSLVLTKNPNKYYPRIEASVIHKSFLKQIYDYLISRGMNGAYYKSKSKPNPKWKTFQDRYRFQFNGMKNLLLFKEIIGFINPKQERKFFHFLEYEKEYSFSIKGLGVLKHKLIRDSINLALKNKMAALGVEPRTSCS